MVVIGTKAGQLANRLFVFAHFIGNATDNGYEVWNASFEDYAEYFEATRDDLFCRYPAKKSALKPRLKLRQNYYSFAQRLMRLKMPFISNTLDIRQTHDPTGKPYLLNSPEFVALRQKSPILMTAGWLFRDKAGIKAHSDKVRQFLTPISSHRENVSKLMGRVRQDCDVVVGVHLRQGDYKQWNDGRYYYETSVYAGLLRQSLALWPGKKVTYLICSNVSQDETLFSGLNYVRGTNHFIEDMYAFAQCDFLIGPPSTYTFWASFYGRVPLYQLQTPSPPLELASFLSHG